VAEDKEHPFIVNADAVAVEVLGTEFNISSYKEDYEIKTVLVEGSVNMSNLMSSKDKIVLEPGQKAVWNRTAQTTKVDEVDVDLYTGWIKGEMIFRNATFKEMTKKLERRYNVDIQNNNRLLLEKRLNARFNVNVETIEDVLNYINEIQPLEYKLSGQNILIE
jgi:ferric-dicitrate binding protein FerR (iron transport regulator)